MTVRDAAPYLTEAIESVRAQTWTDWELVVIDDASQDDSVAIVEQFRRIDPRVRLIRRTEPGGPYVAANEGLRHVRGRFLARMDGDDISTPHRFARELRYLQENPAVRACAAGVMMLVGDRIEPIRVYGNPTLPGAIKWGLCVRGFLQGAAMLETAALREIGGYKELPSAQDHRMWCDLSRRGWLGALEEVVLYYRRHDRQITHTQLARQRYLVAEAVCDHLLELGGKTWSNEDVQRLRSLSFEPAGWKAGFVLIRRFERMWRSDPSLTQAEHHELKVLTRRLRLDHLRASVRGSLSRSFPGRVLLRTYTRLHSAAR